MAEADRLFGSVKADEMVKSVDELPIWTRGEVIKRHGEWVGKEGRRRVLVLLEGCIVDVGGYLEDHVSPTFPILTLFLPTGRMGRGREYGKLMRLSPGEIHYYYHIASRLFLRQIAGQVQNQIHHPQ